MHNAEAMREAAVFGGREYPACALQLADAAEALQPRAVEQIFFSGVFWRVAGGRGPLRSEALRELDIPVDRVADQVDRLELLRVHGYAFGFAVEP